MPTSNEARELAEECDRLVVTATTPENRTLLLKIAQLWRDVASREAAVEIGQAIALGQRRLGPSALGNDVLGNSQAEAVLLKSHARHWRRKASELRVLADEARVPMLRVTFSRLANNYDGLADQAEFTVINLTESEAV